MTSAQPILLISDGTTSISLLDINGILLYDWIPSIPEAKSGGIWKDSPLFEGRQLAYRRLGTVVDTFDLKVRGATQDDAILRLQELRRLLEKAISYWMDDAQNEPVYLKVRAPYETNTRYAVILDYRTPRDANPFRQPFFGCSALVDEFQLAVEHGIWQDEVPGNGTCVEISSIQAFAGSTSLLNISPTAASDDVYWQSVGPALVTGTVYLEMGMSGIGTTFEPGIRFPAVAVPAGSIILEAWIELVVNAHYATTPCNLRIYGEDVDDAATFTDLANFVGRTRTTAFVNWDGLPGTAAGGILTSPDLKTIVQEIVNRVGWASGQDMAFFFPNNFGTAYRIVAAYGHPSYAAPSLHIRYAESDTDFGRTATCTSGEVYVGNAHRRAQLTNVYYKDLSAGPAWSGNLVTAATPFNFLPTPTPGIGDEVYFGIDSTLGDSGPFSSLVFDISTAGVALNGMAWEYYNGGAWAALTVQDNTSSGATYFDRTGVHSVHWIPPANWAATAIQGITGYWVRARLTAAGAATPPYQGNRSIYTVSWPFVEFAAAEVLGDLPALARCILTNQSDNDGSTPTLRANRLLIGSRSTDRGETFTPYLNIADEQNISGVTVTLGGNTAFGNDMGAPSGRSATYTSPAAGTTTEVTITIDSTLSPEYLGRFRAFLRYQYATGSANDVSLQMVTTPGGAGLARYSDVFYPQINTDWQAVDFGIVHIPPRAPSDQYGNITLELIVYASNVGKVVKFYDLVLLPVDEWHTDAVDKSGLAAASGAVGEGDKLDIDSITFPRQPDQAVFRSASTNRIQGYYQNRTAGLALLQANATQKLWFFNIFYEASTELSSSPNVCYTVELYRVQRYHSFRGAR